MASTILATYNDIEDARKVIQDLTKHGFPRDDIGLAVYDYTGDYRQHMEHQRENDNEGVGFGAIAGTLIGAAAGLFAITVPGIGPIILAGPLSALGGAAAGSGIGAAAGAATGGVTDALLDMGVSDDDANYYAESLRRGDVLVSLTVTAHDADHGMHIMREHQPIDIDKRVVQWRKEGWDGFDPLVDPYTAEDLRDYRTNYHYDTDYEGEPVRRYDKETQ